MKLKFSTIKDETLLREKKGKGVETGTSSGILMKPDEVPKEKPLATLDIFAGCGGLSHGLENAGMYLYSHVMHILLSSKHLKTFIKMHVLCNKVYLLQSGRSSMKSQLVMRLNKTILKQRFLLTTAM